LQSASNYKYISRFIGYVHIYSIGSAVSHISYIIVETESVRCILTPPIQWHITVHKKVPTFTEASIWQNF